MTTSLSRQTLSPARHKIDLTRSREKLLPLAPKKPMISRRPALYFIRGIETPPNAPFFPPIPPSFRLRFGAPIATLSTSKRQASARRHQPIPPSLARS